MDNKFKKARKEKMNTEEAIEFLETFKEVVTSLDIENGEGKAIEEYNDKIDGVGQLLQNQAHQIRKLQQPIKKTITIEIEGEDDITLGLATVTMKQAFDNWDFEKKGVSFKVKEKL